MFCSLILAAGKGTRFWPKSTEEKPKQFLNLLGEKTMLQMTCERVLKIMPIENIFVVTAEKHKELIKEQLPNLPERNIIIQPEVMNTAPCILLSCLYIKQIYENANIAVLPSDHIIGNNEEFCKTLQKANDYIENKNREAIITIGITPNRPEGGYGYIKYPKNELKNKNGIIKVEKFVEKPSVDTAREYLKEGNYLWNAGMFIFNLDFMLNEFKKNFNKSYEILNNLPKITDENYLKKAKEEYVKCEATSIDYTVMEKSDAIYVIPNDFGWDDIGTWIALQRYIEPDSQSNFIKGNVSAFNSKNNVVYGEGKKIILLDVDDIFCIDADDVIVIGKKEKLRELHELRNQKY